MRLAIISDTHDNIPNLKKVLDYCRENKIEKLIRLPSGKFFRRYLLDFRKYGPRTQCRLSFRGW